MNKEPVHMLLAEDNTSDAELILASLAKDNLSSCVHIVYDGVEALDFLFSRGPYTNRAHAPPLRLIVLDVKLPKVDGLQVLEELKADPQLKSLPVVMLTSSKIERDVVRAYRLGANAYVQKPVDFDRFRETVRQLGVFWLTMNEPPPASALVSDAP